MLQSSSLKRFAKSMLAFAVISLIGSMFMIVHPQVAFAANTVAWPVDVRTQSWIISQGYNHGASGDHGDPTNFSQTYGMDLTLQGDGAGTAGQPVESPITGNIAYTYSPGHDNSGTCAAIQSSTFEVSLCHMTLSVSVPSNVQQGQVIGTIHEDPEGGNHLHFNLRTIGTIHNPIAFTGAYAIESNLCDYPSNGTTNQYYGTVVTCLKPGGWWIGPTPTDMSFVTVGSTLAFNARAVDNNNGGLSRVDITMYNPATKTWIVHSPTLSGTSTQADAYTEFSMPNADYVLVSFNTHSKNGATQLAPNGVRKYCRVPFAKCEHDSNDLTMAYPGGIGGGSGNTSPNTGTCNSPSVSQVSVFTGANYSGTCALEGIGDYPNPSAIGLPNDSITSVKIGGNVKVQLCDSDNYTTPCEFISGDDPDLTNNSIGKTTSSLKVVSLSPTAGSLMAIDNLSLSTSNAQVGQYITSRFGIQNVGGSSLTVQNLATAVRYGTSWDAPQYDYPAVTNITLQPGEVYYYSDQRTFTQPGGYFAQPVAQVNGTWASVAGSSQVNFTISNPSAPSQGDQQSLTIYDEALVSGWENWSWSSTVDLGNTARAYTPSHAVLWSPGGAYAGFYLHKTTPINTSGYNALSFAMKGTWAGQTYGVTVYDANGNSTGSLVKLANFGGDPPVNYYHVYTIPLSAFGAVNTQISGFHIQDLNGSTTPAAAYIDRITLEGNLGGVWVPLPTNKLLAYNDALASGWQSWSWDSTFNWTGGPSYTGNNSLVWTPTAGWAGLDIHNPTGINTASYTTVHFAMKATAANEQFAVYLEGASNQGLAPAIPLTNYGCSPVTGWWMRCDIPLADLGGANTTVTGIVIQSNVGTSQPNVYVDEVGFY
jgi:hypothetical protein